GLLYDFPQGDDLFAHSLRLGLDEVAASGRIDRDIELVEDHARGLPSGSEHDIKRAFAALDEGGAIAIVGPSISDNALIAAPLADTAGDLLTRLRGGHPDVLVYLGLGVSSRAVAVARLELGWDVPVLANSALMFGYARRDWRDGYAGWEYVDTVADDNPQRASL